MPTAVCPSSTLPTFLPYFPSPPNPLFSFPLEKSGPLSEVKRPV